MVSRSFTARVFSKVCRQVEAFPAPGAVVRFNARVDGHVCVQGERLTKCFTTDFAFERSLPRVSSHMFDQGVSPAECFSAHMAGEGLLSPVDHLVSESVCGVAEGFPAYRAAVRFLSCVHPEVVLQITLHAKSLTALFTSKFFFLT